jgi:SLOG-like protein
LSALPLSNRIIAMSVSETPDLAVLGMLEGEDKLFLGAALTPLVFSDARVAYGGRIEHPGSINFTLEISAQLSESYRRMDTALGKRPIIQYLRAQDAQNAGSEKLFAHALRLGSHSEIRLLSGDITAATLLPAGRMLDVHVGAQAPVACMSSADLAAMPEIKKFLTQDADDGLPALRRVMTAQMDARITMGGAVARTAEGRSGVIAEGLAALDAGKPLLIVGGVGGASRDMAVYLGLLDSAERVSRDDAAYIDKDGKPSKDRYDAQLQEIAARRSGYERRITELRIDDAVRRLAISESHLEIGALMIEVLTKWLPERQ